MSHPNPCLSCAITMTMISPPHATHGGTAQSSSGADAATGHSTFACLQTAAKAASHCSANPSHADLVAVLLPSGAGLYPPRPKPLRILRCIDVAEPMLPRPAAHMCLPMDQELQVRHWPWPKPHLLLSGLARPPAVPEVLGFSHSAVRVTPVILCWGHTHAHMPRPSGVLARHSELPRPTLSPKSTSLRQLIARCERCTFPGQLHADGGPCYITPLWGRANKAGCPGRSARPSSCFATACLNGKRLRATPAPSRGAGRSHQDADASGHFSEACVKRASRHEA